MRVLVCGARDWRDAQYLNTVLNDLRPTVVIEGEAPGADMLARQWAEQHGIRVEAYIRNRQMLNEGRPDLIVAFHENLAESKGTLDMVTLARRAGIPLVVLSGRNSVVG